MEYPLKFGSHRHQKGARSSGGTIIKSFVFDKNALVKKR
jgi:hypothetical protein